MLKHTILALSFCAPLYCMVEQIKPTDHNGHSEHVSPDIFLQLLETNKINTKKSIICIAPENLSDKLKENASIVYRGTSNKLLAMRLQNHMLPKICQLAVTNFDIDTASQVNPLFQFINDNLEMNGELFIATLTKSNQHSHAMFTILKIMPDIQQFLSYLTIKEIRDAIMPSYPSLTEIKAMLNRTGFEIIKAEEQLTYEQSDTSMLKELLTEDIVNSPLYRLLQDESSQQKMCELYVQNYIAQLETTDNPDIVINKHVSTVIHARKVKI